MPSPARAPSLSLNDESATFSGVMEKWNTLPCLFPNKGGYLISIDEYQKLLKLAGEHEAVLKEQPPLRGRLVRGTATAVIEKDILKVEANYVAVVQGAANHGEPRAVDHHFNSFRMRHITNLPNGQNMSGNIDHMADH